MSFDLCRVKMADNPYFIENISTYIYSIEELCFFLKENIYLIDGSIMNEALCDWIRDELQLRTLYRQLYDRLEKMGDDALTGGADASGSAVASFVMPIFREIGYLTPKQMKSYQDTLSRLAVQPEDAKEKMKGDYLARSGMYGNAVNEYLQILNRQRPGSAGAQFYAQVLENLGCAYARMFHFEEAADAFERAWRIAHSKEALRRFVSVLPFFLPEKTCERRIRELGADETAVDTIRAQNVRIARQAGRRMVADGRQGSHSREEMDQRLKELKNTYRRYSNRNAKE